MRLVKHGHSCVSIQEGGRALVVDPGVFCDATAALAGAGGVLITHDHADHLDVAAVRAACTTDPDLPVWGPASVTVQLADLGDRVTTVDAGQSFEAAGFEVRTFGGQHALVHPAIPVAANVGYLVAATVYHPGDSLTVPDVAVPFLLAPTSGPWSKLAEVIDFMVAVRAPRAAPIHDAPLSAIGLSLVERIATPVVESYGVDFRPFGPGDVVEL
jgi:L-ascorbate metabolism protein UlaG (beta-lactamase superfamily)